MTDAPVNLDQATEDLWLLRNLSSGFADEPLKRLAAVIAELRAARAVSQEASGLRAEVERLKRELVACANQLGHARDAAQKWHAIAQEHGLDERAGKAPTADHEPFETMECCGRDRDKDGGPNPHCECPAPLKASPADEVAGLLAMLKHAQSTSLDGRCSVTLDVLNELENHLKGKR